MVRVVSGVEAVFTEQGLELPAFDDAVQRVGDDLLQCIADGRLPLRAFATGVPSESA